MEILIEYWVTNVESSRSTAPGDDSPAITSKAELHQRKIVLSMGCFLCSKQSFQIFTRQFQPCCYPETSEAHQSKRSTVTSHKIDSGPVEKIPEVSVWLRCSRQN
ncbi:hypothetical protein TNCV_4170701 [Trichonephila clavipes]|nr:hypothetical protein TNCV_4170701 [Trichonephila clavipes]